MAPICEEWIALEALIEAPTNVQTCHRDLWADNVRIGTDGRVWVIDWQDCGLADPAQELAALLFEYGGPDGSRASAMHSAYVSAGGRARIDGPGGCTMLVAQLGHLLEIACRRWLAPDATDEVRALNEPRILEFVERPLDRTLISRLLDATRG